MRVPGPHKAALLVDEAFQTLPPTMQQTLRPWLEGPRVGVVDGPRTSWAVQVIAWRVCALEQVRRFVPHVTAGTRKALLLIEGGVYLYEAIAGADKLRETQVLQALARVAETPASEITTLFPETN